MSQAKHQISVIVPVFNEEWAIYPIFGKLQEVIDVSDRLWEIIFVNDGSTDQSQTIIDEIVTTYAHVKCIQFRRNFGLTQALQAGFDYAEGEYIVTLSGNLQNDPKDIPSLIEQLDQGFDVCAGWQQDQDGVLARRRPARLLNWAISKISGITLHDYECTLRAYRKQLIDGLNMYGQLERYIPVYVSWRGGRVSEIPVTQHPRSHGHGFHGSRTKRTLKTIFDLILLKYLERFSTRPFYLFGTLSLFNFVISFLALVLMLFLKLFRGDSFIDTPLPLVSALFFLAGVSLGILGIIAEMLSRILLMVGQKTLYDIKNVGGFK